MAGPVSQSESDVYYRRLINAAKSLQDVYEEIKRLRSENTTFDLSTNLDEESSGVLTKAEAISFFGVLADYESFYENATVTFDGTDGGAERRNKINPFLAAEAVVGR